MQIAVQAVVWFAFSRKKSPFSQVSRISHLREVLFFPNIARLQIRESNASSFVLNSLRFEERSLITDQWSAFLSRFLVIIIIIFEHNWLDSEAFQSCKCPSLAEIERTPLRHFCLTSNPLTNLSQSHSHTNFLLFLLSRVAEMQIFTSLSSKSEVERVEIKFCLSSKAGTKFNLSRANNPLKLMFGDQSSPQTNTNDTENWNNTKERQYMFDVFADACNFIEMISFEKFCFVSSRWSKV